MQEDTSFRGDVIGLCISIKGRHTEGKGRQQRGLISNIVYYSCGVATLIRNNFNRVIQKSIVDPQGRFISLKAGIQVIKCTF